MSAPQVTVSDVWAASAALAVVGGEPTWANEGTLAADLASAVNWQAHRDGRKPFDVLAEALYKVRVYPPKDHGGTWGVSHHECWVEGRYASAAAAAKAPFVGVDALSKLWASVSPGTITEAQLDALAEVAPANPKLPHNPPQVGHPRKRYP